MEDIAETASADRSILSHGTFSSGVGTPVVNFERQLLIMKFSDPGSDLLHLLYVILHFLRG